MDNLEIDLRGLDELQNDLKKAIKMYPDKAQETLEGLGKKFKSRAIKNTYKAVRRLTGNLTKGYKVDPVSGYGINMKVDFRGTAPHHHLIENGHEIVMPKTRRSKGGRVVNIKSGGENKGFVPGRLMIKQTRDEFSSIVPEKLKEMCDDILRGSDLT